MKSSDLITFQIIIKYTDEGISQNSIHQLNLISNIAIIQTYLLFNLYIHIFIMGQLCDQGTTGTTNMDQFFLRTGISLSHFSQNQNNSDRTVLMIAGADQKPKNFVRNYLIYNFYIKKYKSIEVGYEQKLQFFVNVKYPSYKQKMTQFLKNYKKQLSEADKNKYVLDYALQQPYLIDMINQVLSQYSNPKYIGYLTFLLARVTQTIKKKYQIQDKNLQKRPQIYIVIALRQDQITTLKKIKDKNIILSFRSFLKGFKSQSAAKTKMKSIKEDIKNKNKKIVLLRVHFHKLNMLRDQVDSGYYIKDDQNIIFNLFQGFRVDSCDSDTEFDLTYSYLSHLYHTRVTDRNSLIDDSALNIYNMCDSISSYSLKTQSTLLRILKTDEESLTVSQILTTNSNRQAPGPGQINSDLQSENLINIYIDKSKFQQALKLANQHETNFMIKAKKLQILYKSGKKQETKQYLESLLKNPQKNSRENSQASQVIQFIASKIEIQGNQMEKAKQRVRKLHRQMSNKYNDSYQIIGKQVIALKQQLQGSKTMEKDGETALSQTSKKQSRNINESDLNLRGVSTTI